jgi:thiol-disulfide isomerase/thioredoxin
MLMNAASSLAASRWARPAAWLLLAVACPSFASAGLPTPPARVETQLRCKTITGQALQPLSCDGGVVKAAVVVFITTDCPVANRYAPELERIRNAYAAQGVKFTLVQVDPALTETAARDHAAAYALKAAVVIDRQHELVAATGVKVTPEAVIIDPAGRIRYRGRINDQFTDFGTSRKAPSTHDLREALNAVLAGRQVQQPETPPVGCLIPQLKKS